MSKETLFTNFRINLVDHATLKANVSCKIADVLYLTGMKIVDGKNGTFVAMPSVKDHKGEYRDIYFPASKEVRDELSKVILEHYAAITETKKG